MRKVLLTDHAWPDVSVERAVIEGAGHALVAGPAEAAAPDAIAALARSHDPAAIMTCWAQVGKEAIEACSRLEIVARMGVGLDNIDVAAAERAGAVVTNVPDYCVEEVSDHAVALTLDWARGISRFDRDVKSGNWDPSGARLRRMRDLTVGIVGFGRIGTRTARKMRAFGCRLLAHSRSSPSHGGSEGVAFTSLEELAARSDVAITHLPLTESTRGIFSADFFARMKPGSLFVNVSRGALVDNEALLSALGKGRPGAAALDVIDGEPAPPAAVTGHPEIVATPHIAFSSDASLAELRRRAAEEVVRVLAGEAPSHPCTPWRPRR